MSEHILQAGDIRSNRSGEIYLVVESPSEEFRAVWITGFHENMEEFSPGINPALSVSQKPSLKDKYICNVSRAFFNIDKKIKAELRN